MIEGYFKAWSNTLLAAQVVSARLPMLYMLMIDPTPGRQRELSRMITEKQLALIEGIAGAQALLAGGSIATPKREDGCRSLLDAYVEALTLPAERILRANARRLYPDTQPATEPDGGID